ncbi:Sec-independent protein translocase protein TatB [Sphingomicrobium clamense]|uniref:Sec-independent protein translocase protein TatB n=1 Tax=Sphingomicrobium clamense TaxID=2851013 RepID=A0ABS6V4D2_9SPHN|nr:Sec-independent protein translocase protein TatB [Sphingomicrobium sp. B8]MBW0144420.1 Sec-independent protein translocase protein TatB [Sphingomicrobium sp. B8]
MFGVDGAELLVVAIAALIFIGPKQLPVAMRTVGRWVGKIRGYARHFNAGIESVMREAELEAMEKEWREQNARIMAQYPNADAQPPMVEPKSTEQGDEPDAKPERDLP